MKFPKVIRFVTIAASLSSFGLAGVEPAAVLTDTAPVIDGVIDDSWSAAPSIPLNVPVLVDQGFAVETDAVATFCALYDAQALYLLVTVQEDNVTRWSDRVWSDDSIEIYLDPDLSRGTQYDGINDVQVGVSPLDPPFVVEYGAFSIPSVLGLATANQITDSGYISEVSFPWASFGLDPSGIEAIGIEVAVNDGDAFQGLWPPGRIACGILQRNELTMPEHNRAWRDQGGIFLKQGPTEFFTFLGEVAALAVAQFEFLARLIELLLQDAIFFEQILDDCLLFSVHPARQYAQNQMCLTHLCFKRYTFGSYCQSAFFISLILKLNSPRMIFVSSSFFIFVDSFSEPASAPSMQMCEK